MSQGPRSGLAAVSSALLAMSRHLEVRDVLKTIVASARELLDAQYAALGVPDDPRGFGPFVGDGVSDAQWKAIGPLPRQHGILAAMLHEATPERLADVRKDPRFEGWPSAHPEMVDFLGLPIRDGDEVIGALFLANKNCPKPEGSCGFTEEDEELLGILAPHAAVALTHAPVYARRPAVNHAPRRARRPPPAPPPPPPPARASPSAPASPPPRRSAPASLTNCTTRSARSSSPCA